MKSCGRLLHAFLGGGVISGGAAGGREAQNRVLPFHELVAHVQRKTEQRKEDLDGKDPGQVGHKIARTLGDDRFDEVDYLGAQVVLEWLDHPRAEEGLQDPSVSSLLGWVKREGHQWNRAPQHVERFL